MKVDGGIGFNASEIPELARQAEEFGYDGIWAAETGHDPFLPLAVAASATERIELGTSIAVAFEHNATPTRFARLPSLEGHDSFLVDIPRFDAEIRSFLA